MYVPLFADIITAERWLMIMPMAVLSNFLIYCVINAFTPGPGNILALNTVTNYGYKKGKLQSLKTAQEKDSEIPIVLADFLLKNFNVQAGHLLDDSGKRTIVSSQSFISRQWWAGKQL